MPYIKQRDRKSLQKRRPKTSGELNYLLTMRIKKYIESFPRLSYDTFNFVYGVLDGIRADMRDRNWGHHNYHDGLEKDLVDLCISYTKNWPVVSNHEIKQIRGAIVCVMLEFYRRVMGSYEDIKMQSNGDCFSGLL